MQIGVCLSWVLLRPLDSPRCQSPISPSLCSPVMTPRSPCLRGWGELSQKMPVAQTWRPEFGSPKPAYNQVWSFLSVIAALAYGCGFKTGQSRELTGQSANWWTPGSVRELRWIVSDQRKHTRLTSGFYVRTDTGTYIHVHSHACVHVCKGVNTQTPIDCVKMFPSSKNHYPLPESTGFDYIRDKVFAFEGRPLKSACVERVWILCRDLSQTISRFAMHGTLTKEGKMWLTFF